MMYFPYFRGKQFELMAIKESVSFSDICPIIEPVRINLNPLKITCDTLASAGKKFCLIVNPQVGELQYSSETLTPFIRQYAEKCYPAFILESETSGDQLKQFLTNHKSQELLLIHKDFRNPELLPEILSKNKIYAQVFDRSLPRRYIRLSMKDNCQHRIMLSDSFRRMRNADYVEEESFSDQHVICVEDHWFGFGDYLIVGDDYFDAGGPAYAIALHLTYIDSSKDDEMRIYHFVSNDREDQHNPEGKFFQALEKMLKRIGKNANPPNFDTKGCSYFRECAEHYPGLGSVKKFSMLHHLELLSRYACSKS